MNGSGLVIKGKLVTKESKKGDSKKYKGAKRRRANTEGRSLIYIASYFISLEVILYCA
jgi:hypothetical protein